MPLRIPATRLTLTRAARVASLATVAALALSACGAVDDTGTAAPDPATASGFPLTITNCGVQVTIKAPPKRVVLLKSAPVQYLQDLGVMNTVIARAGAYPRGYYDDDTWAAIEKIPSLSDDLDPSGHLQVSKEVVLAQRPDLVLGTADNLNHETLGAAGIPVLEEPGLCPQGIDHPTFESVAEQFRGYGKVFGIPAEGQQAAKASDQRVAEIEGSVDSSRTLTAAVLYPTVGGGTTYAYGTRSMAEPQLAAAGLTNVFGDVDERVFEVTREELIGRNPDVLILLHSDGSPAAVKRAISGLKGSEAITAVAQDAILVQLFNFTEPPSPLSVDGLARIVETFRS